MAVGQRTSYYFLGRNPIESAASLEEAVRNMIDWWTRQPTLVRHEMGNMIIDLTIGGTTVKVEITDPTVLDDARYDSPTAILDYLASKMGIDAKDARSLLEDASATVEVDTIRVPDDPNAWKPDPGLEASEALPKIAPAFLQELAREEDLGTGRDIGRARSARGRKLVEMAVRAQQQLGISATKMSRETGIPRSTLVDTRARLERQERVKKTFGERKPGQRLNQNQVEVVLKQLQRHEGNAARTARELGLAPRTVREIRQRTQRAVKAPTAARTRRTYTETDRRQVIALVKNQNLSATEAARRAGVPSRTARGWVRRARIEAEEE